MCFHITYEHPCGHTRDVWDYCEFAVVYIDGKIPLLGVRPATGDTGPRQSQIRPCPGKRSKIASDPAQKCGHPDCAGETKRYRWKCCVCGRGPNKSPICTGGPINPFAEEDSEQKGRECKHRACNQCEILTPTQSCPGSPSTMQEPTIGFEEAEY